MMNDLISRQAAIEAVSEACYELRGVFGRCEDALKALPSAPGLPEEDLQEIQDRFGDFVRFVVEDMITGEEKRWNNDH